ncbi:hypothetical protein G9A89_006762 [Geosiphon pyriformis]|nr:hypothetical protein G9A89_006762 [Geosiphon pyriformis]
MILERGSKHFILYLLLLGLLNECLIQAKPVQRLLTRQILDQFSNENNDYDQDILVGEQGQNSFLVEKIMLFLIFVIGSLETEMTAVDPLVPLMSSFNEEPSYLDNSRIDNYYPHEIFTSSNYTNDNKSNYIAFPVNLSIENSGSSNKIQGKINSLFAVESTQETDTLKTLVPIEELKGLEEYARWAALAYCLKLNDQTSKFSNDILGSAQLEPQKKRIIFNFLGVERHPIEFKKNTRQIDYPPTAAFSSFAKVHAGLYQRFNGAQVKILKNLVRIKKIRPEWKFVLTGHGLGGAYAVLAGLALINIPTFQDEQIIITTFGEPRIGNKEFAEYVDNIQNFKIYRFTHTIDPFVQMPASDSETRYTHHKLEYWIADSANTVYKCDTSPGVESEESYSD